MLRKDAGVDGFIFDLRTVNSIHVVVHLPEQHTIILAHMDLVISKAQFMKIIICIIIC